MTSTLLNLVPGLLIGLGFTALLAALLPVRPQLADALARIGTTDLQETRYEDRRQRIGSWAHKHIPDIAGVTASARDLDLLGVGAADFYWRKTYLAAAGLVLPSLVGLATAALGLMPVYLPAVLGLPLAILFWILPDIETRQKAKQAREQFARAVGTYFELVASERLRGAPAGHSLSSAAEVAETWIFRRIRQEIRRGRYAGIQPWNAVANLSEDIGVPELKDIARIVQLSGEAGAEIYEPLRNRGRSLRLQMLTDEHAKANKASEQMTAPITLLALVFAGLIITPLMMNTIG